MQYYLSLFTLIGFLNSMPLIQSAQISSKKEKSSSSLPKQRLMSSEKISRFRKFGLEIVENEPQEACSNFYVPKNRLTGKKLNPYDDLIRIVPEIDVFLLANLETLMNYITKEEKRICFIRLLQNIFRVMFKLKRYKIVHKQSYIAIQIPYKEKIYMVFEKNKNPNPSNIKWDLQYSCLYKHSDLPIFLRKQLGELETFSFSSEEIIKPVNLDHPIFIFIEHDSRLLKITKDNSESKTPYCIQFITCNGVIDKTIRIPKKQVQLAKCINHFTGEMGVIMKIRIDIKKGKYMTQHFILSLLKATYDRDSSQPNSYIAKVLAGNIKNKRKFNLKYFKFNLMYQLGRWFASEKYKNALIKIAKRANDHAPKNNYTQLLPTKSAWNNPSTPIVLPCNNGSTYLTPHQLPYYNSYPTQNLPVNRSYLNPSMQFNNNLTYPSYFTNQMPVVTGHAAHLVPQQESAVYHQPAHAAPGIQHIPPVHPFSANHDTFNTHYNGYPFL